MVSCVVLGALTATALGLTTAPAEARRRHHAHHVRHVGGYNPPYASIVVDANTGRVLEATNADAPRHPASITKVMTLYLLFEALEAGRVHLDTEMRVSAKAAAQAPSKLGFRPGDTIDVEDAIKAIVTKSANDVAMVIAENIGGSEAGFAAMMNAKARELGMRGTHYNNPNGLPDPGQITTARDLALLGRAIQERFPKQYRYFSTHSFVFRGRVIPSHNRLIGRIQGVDGIKTGYTRASGFNLLTNARFDGRHIVGVVLGGRTAAWRDQRMASLIEGNMDRAYAGRDIAPVLARNAPRDSEPVLPERVARVEPAPAAVPQPVERPKPAVVAELTEPAEAPLDTRRVGQPVRLAPQGGSTAIRSASMPVGASMASTTPMRWVTGPRGRPLPNQLAQAFAGRPIPPGTVPYTNSIAQQVAGGAENQPLPAPVDAAAAAPAPVKVAAVQSDIAVPAETTASIARTVAAPRPTAVPAKAVATPAAAARPEHKGWIIQLAATDDRERAMSLLESAKARTRGPLRGAEPFTEKVVKGAHTLYRARFAGFEDDRDAQAACRAVKRAGFSCIAQKG